jgi:hypothetical protein
MRVALLSIFAASLVVACSGSSAEGGNEVDAGPWNDTAMQTLVATKCAIGGCHDGSESPNFKNISEAAMKANREALTQVQSGKMPRTGSLTAEEKATFIAFYQ